uniref:Uncharacterized protein n=1 Tax=Caudovirales sp. ctMVT27 TaxID=2826771 RepID=A0A8S5M2Z0_9CAUD|nr:MAG TPA: hypothetical protein [Caudovirales sp. ctMVT27]
MDTPTFRDCVYRLIEGLYLPLQTPSVGRKACQNVLCQFPLYKGSILALLEVCL